MGRADDDAVDNSGPVRRGFGQCMSAAVGN